MSHHLFSKEMEFAAAAATLSGEPVSHESLANSILEVAKSTRPHLRDLYTNGVFFTNGSLLYVDQGCHPEVSLPECSDPWEVVRYCKAAERILSDIVAEVGVRARPNLDVRLFKGNVDYSGTLATWGSHESYMHSSDPELLPREILSHLVSRVIYSGAGGFDPHSPGLHFVLSPRATHLHKSVSTKSTAERGIYHTKDESLTSGPYHRLHVIAGESVSSEIALWLTVGATALVVAMAEAGLHPGETVRLSNPIQALGVFVRDPTCHAVALTRNGKTASAIDIQRHYLQTAEDHLHDSFMPEWADDVCVEWRRVLDLLADAPQSVARTLDWGIKFPLYRDHAAKRGFSPEAVSRWTFMADRIAEALRSRDLPALELNANSVLSAESPIASVVEALTPNLRAGGLDWNDFEAFLALRLELLEIDTKFGQVGDTGIFELIDKSGILNHHVLGVDNIDEAIQYPPALGRAKLRGTCVTRFAHDTERYQCAWTRVVDQRRNRLLDLTDPFATRERWQKAADEDALRVPHPDHAEVLRALRSRQDGLPF